MSIDQNIKNVKKEQINFQIDVETLMSLKEMTHDKRRTYTSLIAEVIELALEKKYNHKQSENKGEYNE